MDVTAVGSAANTTATTVGGPQSVDYQSFLKLLVAQMKNQDPTSPMESTDYVAQLATFSQVEQSIQMNKKLEAMIHGSAMSQASGLIGHHVETMDGRASGIVKQIEMFSDGTVLVLENGTKVPMGSSLIIRDAGATPPEPDTDTETVAGDGSSEDPLA
jgi:flagellar basal-body rod modification protein FlgD